MSNVLVLKGGVGGWWMKGANERRGNKKKQMPNSKHSRQTKHKRGLCWARKKIPSPFASKIASPFDSSFLFLSVLFWMWGEANKRGKWFAFWPVAFVGLPDQIRFGIRRETLCLSRVANKMFACDYSFFLCLCLSVGCWMSLLTWDLWFILAVKKWPLSTWTIAVGGVFFCWERVGVGRGLVCCVLGVCLCVLAIPFPLSRLWDKAGEGWVVGRLGRGLPCDVRQSPIGMSGKTSFRLWRPGTGPCGQFTATCGSNTTTWSRDRNKPTRSTKVLRPRQFTGQQKDERNVVRKKDRSRRVTVELCFSHWHRWHGSK